MVERESLPYWKRFGRLVVFTFLVGCCSSAIQAADVKELIEKAYQRTTNASTVKDYEETIAACEEARQAGLAAEQEKYVMSLMSWAYNRRGEALTENASQAHSRGETQPASDLDRKALADFELAIQLDPTRWKPWHNRGVSRAIAGKYQQAVTDFSQVIVLNPQYSNAWFNRAEIRFDLGQFEKALADYSESIRLSPEDADAHACRGDTSFRLGRMEDALADYDESIRIKPTADALASRGDAFQSVTKWREAAEDYRQAIQLDPESPRVLQGAAWLMSTCPDVAIRNAKLAVEAAEKAIQRQQSPDFRFFDTLAAALANSGRYDEAVAKMNEAIGAASTKDAPTLKRRLDLYRQKQPYRQDGGDKTANTTPAKKKR